MADCHLVDVDILLVRNDIQGSRWSYGHTGAGGVGRR